MGDYVKGARSSPDVEYVRASWVYKRPKNNPANGEYVLNVMKNLSIKTKATRQACIVCKKKTGKLEFHLLVGGDKVEPYHSKCLAKKLYEKT
jgi:hypothetical protein